MRILVSDRHLQDITEDAFDALVRANSPERFFERGDVLVRLHHSGGRAWSEVMNPDATRGELDRAARFIQLDRHGLPAPARPPMDVLRDILALPRLPFPELLGISYSPVLTEHGILARSGYDPRIGLYLCLTGLGDLRGDMPLDDAKGLLIDELSC